MGALQWRLELRLGLKLEQEAVGALQWGHYNGGNAVGARAKTWAGARDRARARARARAVARARAKSVEAQQWGALHWVQCSGGLGLRVGLV